MTNNLFASHVMVNLTRDEAQKALNVLYGKKAILLKRDNRFIYTPIRGLDLVNGVAETSTLGRFSILHEDGDDYHIKVVGVDDKPITIDLAKVYTQSERNPYRWVRLGNQVDPDFFRYRKNDTYYVYKETDQARPPKRCRGVGKVQLPKEGSGVTLMEDEEDYKFNNAHICELRQID
ncbi:MAG: hypothetical protein DRR19_22060 [Candidatus Parabeggiatoa sp. nov. 1]|nr:MAG: hypothetical protein DRR19_22060 [Gammaproteobacteria bacterium]